MPGFGPAAELLLFRQKDRKPLTPSSASSMRTDAVERAAQLAVLKQGPLEDKSVRPWGQTAGVGHRGTGKSDSEQLLGGMMGEKLLHDFFRIATTVLVLSLLSVPTFVWGQTVKAYVDRNPVMADETLRLVVEAEGVSSSDAPSLQSLEENFALLGTSHSQQMSIINGRTSSVTRWVTTLAPKRTGMLTIPAIQVGNHSSLPLAITVKDPGQATGADAQRDIYLEAEVDSHFPYVQGQVLLTLRLMSAVSLQEGKLDDPEIDWGMIERVGKDASFETVRDGRRYHVTERRYAITPQKAGEQFIPPVLLSGAIPDERSQRLPLENFFV